MGRAGNDGEGPEGWVGRIFGVMKSEEKVRSIIDGVFLYSGGLSGVTDSLCGDTCGRLEKNAQMAGLRMQFRRLFQPVRLLN